MKICIVIQSDAFRSSAGMRIRYDRFRQNLDPQVATIDSATTAELTSAKSLDHDAYVFCKTFDTAALLLARRVRTAGKAVGHDFFDDYFSQGSDIRLQRYRDWLRDMVPVTDFAICSTPRMAKVIEPFLPGIRVTAIEDPVIGFDRARVAALADAKVARARERKELEIAWFGIGDNPFFPVGLTDLASSEGDLAKMEQEGWTVRLRVVTNRRAFQAANAEVLRSLNVGFELIEWSEHAEQDVLSSATVALIPVNGQSFSRAKSLNRAVTALDAGCQVLSTGYPLYERLRPWIYDNVDDLLADLDVGRAKVGGSTATKLAAHVGNIADPILAAAAFVNEVRQGMQRSKGAQPGTLCVVHGHSSNIAIHKGANAIGGLSVKTIFCSAAWNFPVRFDRVADHLVMRVTPAISQRFAVPVLAEQPVLSLGALDFQQADLSRLGIEPFRLFGSHGSSPLADLTVYEEVMRFVQTCCAAAFAGADIIVSDASPYARRPARISPPSRSSFRPQQRRSPQTTHEPAAPNGRPWSSLRRIVTGKRQHQASAIGHAAALIAASALFDRQWYLSRYPDVANSGVDPVAHYLQFGWREGRNPGPNFSTKGYLRANKDVAERDLNPLVHYLEHGQIEGRAAPPVKGTSVQ